MFSKRPSLPANFDTFDVAFERFFPVGDNGKLVSAEYLIMRRVCKDALDGKRKAVSVIMRYARAQEEARAKMQLHLYEQPLTRQDPERRATTAMSLLSIASQTSPDAEVRLEPWVQMLAFNREGAPTFREGDRERMERYTRGSDEPAPAIFRLTRAKPSARRSPEDTRFKKGKSGNPKGRPKKVRHHVPFTDYLEEVGTVLVNGKNVRMTRLQFVIHMLNLKAIRGDACMTAVLAGKYLPVKVQRRKNGRDVRHPAPLHNTGNLPPRIKYDPFEQMLRYCRITNRRTKTRVLLEPWVVEAALARFRERRLNKEEQTEVLRSTSRPATVRWPEWWEIRSHADAKPYIPVKPRFRRTDAADWYDTRF